MIRIPLTSYLIIFAVIATTAFASLAMLAGLALLIAFYLYNVITNDTPTHRKDAFLILTGLIFIIFFNTADVVLLFRSLLKHRNAFGFCVIVNILFLLGLSGSLLYDKIQAKWPNHDKPYPWTNIFLVGLISLSFIINYDFRYLAATFGYPALGLASAVLMISSYALYRLEEFRNANLIPFFILLSMGCILFQLQIF